MSINIYQSEIREIAETKIGGVEYIIINQSSWYRANNWTREAAIADYKKRHNITEG